MSFPVELIGAPQLRRRLSDRERRHYPRAMSRALNRTAKTMRAETARGLAKATGLTVTRVRRRVAVTRRANPQSLTTVIQGTGRPFNLIEFGARPLRRGGVSAKPWGRRQRFPEAFIRRMPNGVRLVVKQTNVRGKQIQRGRHRGKPAIEAMYGPGIAREMASEQLARARQILVGRRLPIEFERELRFRVGKIT